MTKAEQATFDEFKDGLDKWLDLFAKNIDLRLDHMDEKIKAFTEATKGPLITKKSVIDWPKSIRSAMFIFAGGGGISVAVKTIIENV